MNTTVRHDTIRRLLYTVSKIEFVSHHSQLNSMKFKFGGCLVFVLTSAITVTAQAKRDNGISF